MLANQPHHQHSQSPNPTLSPILRTKNTHSHTVTQSKLAVCFSYVVMRRRRSCSVQVQILVLLLAMVAPPRVKSIWLDVPHKGEKCVSEDLRSEVVVLADYYAIPIEDHHVHANFTPTISAKVTTPYGNNIHHQENVTHGQFAFTTSEDGHYVACFSLFGEHEIGKGISVAIDWKIGIAAKDWESVAKKEKIEGLELELRKLEGAVDAIRQNLIYLKKREAEMREISEKTNAKVASFSIMSIAVCIMVSLLQVGYLKRYFQKRKLI